jgi:alginate O-acetyltransferase complex protein AlgI
MTFTSPSFLFAFLPAAVAAYACCPARGRHALLALLSVLFYAFGDPGALPLLLASILGNYAMGLAVARTSSGRRGAVLAIGVAANLCLLGGAKYAGFVARSAAALLGWDLTWAPPPLPIGVSFYTFHAISYLIDIRRGTAPALRSPVEFALYLSLFPQLLAGPILRFADFAPQLRSPPRVAADNLDAGLRRFAAGLAKKTLLADTVAPLADAAFGAPSGSLSAGAAWLGAVAYALQIYGDFAGYTDMAIGMARMFGYVLPENFRAPYAATSVTDFWRRWHMSLTRWFRAYVYVPLGGNRGSLARTCRNLLLVFALSGLWHCAGWHFVAWGLYFGVLLCAERIWMVQIGRVPPAPVRIALTLGLVLAGWVLFRSPTTLYALQYLGSMAGLGGTQPLPPETVRAAALPLLLGAIACLPVWATRAAAIREGTAAALGRDLWHLLLLLLGCGAVATAVYRPFLYLTF